MMTNMVQFRIRQRYALLTLWFQQAFTSTTWTVSGWLLNANECANFPRWYGIGCASINLGVTVGMQNVVTRVDLGGNNMIGTIPADLGLLTTLTYFVVRNNRLAGTLPASIGQWTALTVFDVSINRLTGTVPASIGIWSQIQNAFFHFNTFAGAIPNDICPNIQGNDRLQADCKNSCTCCTSCS
jgi:hypothetical protein